MPQPIWRKVVAELTVPQNAADQWTLALDYLTPAKIMKIEVVVDAARNPAITGQWTPQGYRAACPADGDLAGTAREVPNFGTLMVASAHAGALIARLGGSTADLEADASTTAPTRIVFSVGRQCVFTVPASPTGSLFLGVNADKSRMTGITGSQVVNIYEAL